MLGLALTVAWPAGAQTPSTSPYLDPVNGLSLEAAVARALAQEPSLDAARVEVDAASGRLRQAALRPNPSLSFERRVEPAGTDRLTMVGVEWPLDLFRRSRRVAVANGDRTIAARALDDRERMLAAEVRDRYGAVVAAIRDLEILEALVDATTDERDLLRARVTAGAAPPLDRDLVEVEVTRVEVERLRQAGRTETALIELKRWLGIEPGEPLRLSSDLERLVSDALPPGLEPARDAGAIDQRSDVQQALARVDTAEARIDLARQAGRVDLGLFGAYMRMDAGFPQLGFSPGGSLERVRGSMQYLAFGARLALPVLNRGQGDVQAAEAERAAALASHRAASLEARSEVAAARVQALAAGRAVAAYRAGARALARQNLDVVRQSYALGRVTVFEVLAEERRWLEVERAYTESLRAAWEARTALGRALGEVR
jgi:cobalt-zinc-cadmium efflux system outer membrane protein